MPVLRHKEPCNVCPWLRTSTAGWLGAATPPEFLNAARGQCEMPCHATIDYERPNWEIQLPSASLCAGALIFLRNTCSMPRDPKHAEATRAVQADRETVFAMPHEFLAHHTR